MKRLVKAIDSGCVRACHDLSEGGLGVAAAEMAFSGGLGLEIWLDRVARSDDLRRNDHILFSESNSRFLVEVSEKAREEFENLMEGRVYAAIGEVAKVPRLIIRGLKGEIVVDALLSDLLQSWKQTLSKGA